MSKISTVPGKIRTSQLVQNQPEGRVATISERNLASSLVTGGAEVRDGSVEVLIAASGRVWL